MGIIVSNGFTHTGVAPDVEVDLDPKAVHDGRDPQLEKAVSVATEELKKHPPVSPVRPPYPDYQRPATNATGSTR
jgi:tricorn protease